ncbi:catalase-like [Sitophilus oryzae]|uniref:Catalase-like n=1 Tax=Sitophilus oryzae TaxID=7048 RepID=A0A6J2YCB3_SITOR|nr:catalase-like [Sitophilus oryzae]
MSKKAFVRDAVANQLVEYAEKHEGEKNSITTNSGNPIGTKDASLTVGYHGPTLLQDVMLLDDLSHFTKERNPERVVHAKGAGAFGYFEVTHDITKYTAAKPFAQIGKRTPIAMRFSTVAGERGYADTVRDVRGFAIKFYTDDGIWDIVGNNTPVFFVKDAAVFSSFIHVMKRNPVTNIRPDYDMFWDFVSLRPECTHQTLITFSDRGTPKSYRNMHGYGSHTYSFVNKEGVVHWIKYHFITNQGIQNLSARDAQRIAGENPDYHTRDLYNAIATKNFPSWDFYIQVMTHDQALKSPYDPFDLTKVWLHADYPLIPVGKIVLNKNPTNYYAEIEQIAMDVAHLIPGVEISPDRMLQGRMFAYRDTHQYRLGPNYNQLPVNRPYVVHNYSRDGYGTTNSQGGAPNYHPNSFEGPVDDKRAQALSPSIPLHGEAKRIDSGNDDNFTQPRLLYVRVLKEDERQRLVENLVEWLKRTTTVIQLRAISNFEQVDKTLGSRLKEALHLDQEYHIEF